MNNINRSVRATLLDQCIGLRQRLGDALKRAEQLQTQREGLLEALREIESMYGYYGPGDMARTASEAIDAWGKHD